MAKLSPMMLVPPLAFAGLAVLFFTGMHRDDPDALPSSMVGRDAPSVAQLVPLSDLPPLTDEALREPGVKLVNVWASWCAPCRAEHPTITQLAEEGIPVYGLNYKDNPDNAQAFLAELGNPYAAIGADDTGRVALDWGVYGVPETFIVDGEGRVRYRFAGPLTQRMLEQDFREELDAAQGR